MRIYQLSHIGEFHTAHNEDFMVVEDCGKHTKMIAVMDGCSSGTDSHFASTLLGKILRKLAKQEAYLEYASQQSKVPGRLIEDIALNLFDELANLNRQLDLQSDEILSTLILAIVDGQNRDVEIVVVGDGMVCIDGNYTEYENDNKPDYIGYHLKMDKHLWFQTRTNRLSAQKVNDVTISTDGIHTFRNFDGREYPSIAPEEIMPRFFESRKNIDNPNKLKKTLLALKNDHGLQTSDDITMIRVIFE